jgi:hypothetical protein
MFLQGCLGDGDQACSQAQIRLLEASLKKKIWSSRIFFTSYFQKNKHKELIYQAS